MSSVSSGASSAGSALTWMATPASATRPRKASVERSIASSTGWGRASVRVASPTSLRARNSSSSASEASRTVSCVGVGDRVAQLLFGASRAPRELELGLEHGDRGSQLVARVGDEVPLAPERALESPEHPVHGPPRAGRSRRDSAARSGARRCRGRRSRRPGDASARRVGARRRPGTRRRSPRARRRSIRRRGTPAAPCRRRCWSPRATSRRPRSGCPSPEASGLIAGAARMRNALGLGARARAR